MIPCLTFTNYIEKITKYNLASYNRGVAIQHSKETDQISSRKQNDMRAMRLALYFAGISSYLELYFGQTRRHLHIGMSEHMGVSLSTGKNLTRHSLSSILAYTHHTQHAISPNDFSIISSASSGSNLELVTRESLLISKLKPSLYENISSIPLSLF